MTEAAGADAAEDRLVADAVERGFIVPTRGAPGFRRFTDAGPCNAVAWWAAGENDEALVMRAVQCGADIFEAMARNAAFRGHVRLARWATTRGEGPDFDFSCVAACAAKAGELRLLRWVLARGRRHGHAPDWDNIARWAQRGGWDPAPIGRIRDSMAL